MKMLKRGELVLIFLLLLQWNITAQNAPENYIDANHQLNYSSLDDWYVRELKESVVLSGKTISLYEVGKMHGEPGLFSKDPRSPWRTTNIYANMLLDVGNTRVFPEKRGNGYCARLETKIRKDNIAGIKLDVLLAGTIFLGEKIEPVKGVKDPVKNVSQGIPFDQKPRAVKFDYKYHLGKTRVEAVYRKEIIAGEDKADFSVILQKRWEDKNGNVFAERIGGTRHFFTGEQKEWINGAEFQIYYGDATHLPQYDPKTMGLIPGVGEVYVLNSKNKLVPLVETGWGNKDDIPTHMIMYFTSSYEGIQYRGSEESVFWIDNIELVY